MQRKKKLGIVGALLAVMMASVAYAWIASNTLHFTTTLAGNPFVLAIYNDYTNRDVLIPPYLPTTMYYEQPVILYTNTKNLANSAYSGVYTNYKIWRTEGGDMQTSWVTVHVHDVTHGTDVDLPLTVVAGNLVYSLGPYDAVAHFSADATVTVTFHNSAPLLAYSADVWVSVPP
jgi:hypothetical protein